MNTVFKRCPTFLTFALLVASVGYAAVLPPQELVSKQIESDLIYFKATLPTDIFYGQCENGSLEGLVNSREFGFSPDRKRTIIYTYTCVRTLADTNVFEERHPNFFLLNQFRFGDRRDFIRIDLTRYDGRKNNTGFIGNYSGVHFDFEKTGLLKMVYKIECHDDVAPSGTCNPDSLKIKAKEFRLQNVNLEGSLELMKL